MKVKSPAVLKVQCALRRLAGRHGTTALCVIALLKLAALTVSHKH